MKDITPILRQPRNRIPRAHRTAQLKVEVFQGLIDMKRAKLLAQLFIDGGAIQLATVQEPAVLRSVTFERARLIVERFRAQPQKRKATA